MIRGPTRTPWVPSPARGEKAAVTARALTKREKSLFAACEVATWAIADWEDDQSPDLDLVRNRVSLCRLLLQLDADAETPRGASLIEIARDIEALLGVMGLTVRSRQTHPALTADGSRVGGSATS